MIPIPSGVRVWIATGHTDMRRGMQSLALAVQESLKGDPHAGDLYSFRGRRCDLVKILWHDGHVALRQAPGSRQVHLAVGVRRRGINLGGADGLHARGHRLAESAIELAAAKRWLSAESVASCILGSPIASNL
ncbi:IS66 family insertion sequence element accessory protein TnpB [Bradyrhizobium shewense]|uniref:IS66 family insertion sequence element accessory protein TnpB n=1 Tax=Bradyrhizobium shewense TaxID=1761772 RepID=UPI003D31BFC2